MFQRYRKHLAISYGCGLGREAVLYLVERGVRVMGTDACKVEATSGAWIRTAGLIPVDTPE